MPLVSVVIPAYRRGHVIERALQSVLEQTYQDFEILVVDDGSKDNTASVVAALAKTEPRIHYLCHDTNRGAQAARNTGIRAATGKWVAFLDSDDYWLPDSLEKRLTIAEKESVEVVYSGCNVIRNDGNLTPFGIPAFSGSIYFNVLISPGPMFQSLLVSKVALEAIEYLDEKIIAYQEWDTSIRLAKLFNFAFMPEPTFIYDCRGDDTISKNMKRDVEGYQQVFNKHFSEVIKQAGPRAVAHHYQNIANRYQSIDEQDSATYYQFLSLLWWPFRFKTAYRKLRRLIHA